MLRDRTGATTRWLIPGETSAEDRRFPTLGRAKDIADHLSLTTGETVNVWSEDIVGGIVRLGQIVYTSAGIRSEPLRGHLLEKIGHYR